MMPTLPSNGQPIRSAISPDHHRLRLLTIGLTIPTSAAWSLLEKSVPILDIGDNRDKMIPIVAPIV